MKYTTEQLGKIDWTKFGKDGWSATLDFPASELDIWRNGCRKACLKDKWAVIASSVDDVKNVLNQIDRCDAFIDSELAAIELAELCRRLRRTTPQTRAVACPSKMHFSQTQTVPNHGPCEVGILTALAEQYRGKEFRVTVEEL